MTTQNFNPGLINSQLVVSPDSDIYSLWKQPPVNPVMKIYLFNLTNVQAWLNGSQPKLRLEQIGPFVYRETWIKKNITFHRFSLILASFVTIVVNGEPTLLVHCLY